MKVAVDTNVLIRAVMRDEAGQASVAARLLAEADLIAVALPCLCEFVWVLRRVYGLQAADAASAIRALLAVANVEVNRPAVESGLALLEAGGKFADGAIAYEGSWLGGESLVSFDKEAVALLTAQGQSAQLLQIEWSPLGHIFNREAPHPGAARTHAGALRLHLATGLGQRFAGHNTRRANAGVWTPCRTCRLTKSMRASTPIFHAKRIRCRSALTRTMPTTRWTSTSG